MTEKQLLKLDGKKVRLEKHAFMHSIQINAYEGRIEVTRSDVFLVRDGSMKCYEHHGFYLVRENDISLFFKYTDLKLFSKWEVIE